MRGINGAGVAIVTAGAILAYSGIKGKNTGDTVRSLLANDTAALQSSPGGSGGTVKPTQNIVTGGITTDGYASSNGAYVVALAKSQLGKPYAWARPVSASEANPSSFDCSGLVMWCYYRIGKRLTHFSPTQYTALEHRPIAQAQPGDVLFWSYTRSGATAYHCAICIGGNQIIEAPDYGIPVRIRSYSNNDPDLVQTVGVCP